MNKILIFLLRLCDYQSVDYVLVKKGEYTDRLIEKTLKTNDFVILNRKGEFYLKKFTLIELVRYEGVISEIRIKHDIDSVVSKPVNGLVIHGRFSGLQRMIDYFNSI